ncbi:uncharacterized protein K452DRAFT_302918 [Aplosporella prunicola CBS 121167]|uniref:mRNA N(6)-methyladenine demethylase n=1 Tax=Aplosporella prunicola CBS 121167 TaxID=1176127 RepID=A0A6A6B0J3_9PEZI|nr:uncharacterized protein K452DRAFT_302918 [Aplosporella prunicola CBS 121167]KAF2136231.1 hypothetical protein K452DRAFT_302918 [Aplosporella prunicola CBS 121167]
MAPSLDAHQRPPDHIRAAYKKFQKTRPPALDADPALVDLVSRDPGAYQLRLVRSIAREELLSAFRSFESETTCSNVEQWLPDTLMPVYEHPSMPGLHIIPSLFPPEVQKILLHRLIHRDLSNPSHKTNVHMYYDIPYPPESSSFFQIPPSSEPRFLPKDPSIHKPLSINQFLSKKLRWVTLGGQYDWTNKVYPAEQPPPFPSDVGSLLEGLFPDMKPQAAIVNFYSPGDTLSMHRDVSEECDRGLVSVSIGCDGIFVIGLNEEDSVVDEASAETQKLPGALALRLRSGDAVYMSGPSRFAWHGVPQIVSDTCPSWLQDWPASPDDRHTDSEKEQLDLWRGWMRTKRINLNVRQMWD